MLVMEAMIRLVGLLIVHFRMNVAPAAVACGDSCPLARADHDGDSAGESYNVLLERR